MIFKHIKTSLLVLLVIGCILQTTQLWFEFYSSHNFFYSSFLRKTRFAEESYEIEPKAIMANITGSLFVSIDPGKVAPIKAVSDSLILDMLKEGQHINTEALNWNKLLEFRCVVYEYAAKMQTDTFAESFNAPRGEIKLKADSFDHIVIVPQRTLSDALRFYVVDSEAHLASSFELKKGTSASLIRELDKLAPLAENGLTYISSVQTELDFFNTNRFLPQWRDSSFIYSGVTSDNPIVRINNLEKCVELFFDNPASIISANDPNGTPFFSDENTVVKYNRETEILEYTNYSQKNRALGQVSFTQAYTSALNFLKRDATLLNDVYMSKAVLEEGSYNLYFDYKINGVPVFVKDPLETDALEDGDLKDGKIYEASAVKSNLRPAIIMTIEGGAVVGYNRVVKELTLSDTARQISDSFIVVLDRLIAESELTGNDGRLEDLTIAYLIDNSGINGMNWFAKAYGKWYYNM